MAISKVVLMALAVLIFVVALPAVRAQSMAPAPAPTSDGQFSLFSFSCLIWFHFWSELCITDLRSVSERV